MLLLLLVLPLSLSIPVREPELDKLINQIHKEISTYFSSETLAEIFMEAAKLMRTDDGIMEMAQKLYNVTRNALTEQQKQECWQTISTAMEKYGGAEKMRKVVMKGFNAFKDLISESIQKDREDFAKMAASGKTNVEILIEIYKRFETYWNITFGQQVIDTVKRTMTPEEWKIATADASKYMKTSNFNLNY